MPQLEIIRLNEILKWVRRSKSMLYSDQQKKLFPSSIKLGGERATGYLKHEVQAVIAARAAGYNNDQIKQLVSDLHSQRQELLNNILSSIPKMGEII